MEIDNSISVMVYIFFQPVYPEVNIQTTPKDDIMFPTN